MADGGGKLRLINGALGLLAESPIVSLADVANTRIGRRINEVYDEVLEAKQSSYQWSFLVSAQPLPESSVVSQYSPDMRVYALPNNLLRVITVYHKEARQMRADYRIDADGLHATSYSGLVVVFMRKMSEDKFPAHFARFLQAALAFEGASIANSNLVEPMRNEMIAREQFSRTVDRKHSSGNAVQLFDGDDILRAREGYDDAGDLRRQLGATGTSVAAAQAAGIRVYDDNGNLIH